MSPVSTTTASSAPVAAPPDLAPPAADPVRRHVMNSHQVVRTSRCSPSPPPGVLRRRRRLGTLRLPTPPCDDNLGHRRTSLYHMHMGSTSALKGPFAVSR